jgi:hypothetical protein
MNEFLHSQWFKRKVGGGGCSLGGEGKELTFVLKNRFITLSHFGVDL